MMNDKAEDLAYGRWPDVLEHAGIASSHFNGKHGPCPICGGKDRFRWAKKHGGTWVCSQCTEDKYANGFKMLMLYHGWTFREAADFIRAYFQGSAARGVTRAPVQKEGPAADNDRSLRRMCAIWEATREMTEGDPAHRYLCKRVPGLNFMPRYIRFHPALDYWAPPQTDGGRPQLVGKFPAMVARCFDPSGRFVQLHKTYLTEDGQKANVPVAKKTDKGIGVNGFAVPILPVKGDTLGFAEGIESAVAGAMFREIPVWPCLNGPSMAAFDLPASLMQQVRHVVIFEDHDELRRLHNGGMRRAGEHYASQLAQRMRAHGKRVLILRAGRVGLDMADHWVQTQRPMAAAMV